MNFKPQAYELDAYCPSAHLFFCRRIEIPSDLQEGEEEGYALLELESMSPFPLDHLFHGHILDEAKRFAFVFAFYKRRLEGVDTHKWRRIDAVLPEFMVALKQTEENRGPLVLVTESSYTAFFFDDASSLPASFIARARRKEELEEGESEQSRIDAFWNSVSKNTGEGSPRIWLANTDHKWVGQTAYFGAVEVNGSPAAKVAFSRDEIWSSDLRDPAMVEQAQKDDRQNAILWKGVIGLAAAIALLLLGEVYWAGSSLYLAQRKSWNAGRADHVASINTLQSTTNTLLRFQESNLVPFQMIEELIPYTEWPKVIFRKFETDGPDSLIIEARADNQREMTEFKRRLERFNKVRSVELSNQQNNTSGSTFKTTIRFVPGSFLNLREVASNE